MKIVTSEVLCDKYGKDVLDLVKKLGTDIEVLKSADNIAAKQYMDSVNDEILIFGGPDVVEHWTVINPASDEDSSVLTDNPYGCHPQNPMPDPSFLIPNRVVTRLPDENINYSVNFIENMVNHQLRHLNEPNALTGWHTLTASAWAGINSWFNQHFNTNSQHLVPPEIWNDSTFQMVNKKYSLLNVHGAKTGTPHFYGQKGSDYPVALKPVQGNFKDCLVFAEACYGSWILQRNKEISIPLMALYSGAVGYIGSTSTSYGPPSPLAKAGDLLAVCFFENILQGLPIGKALLQAKVKFAEQTIMAQRMIDAESKKTLLQYMAYSMPNVILK